jgi:hypothetical protein
LQPLRKLLRGREATATQVLHDSEEAVSASHELRRAYRRKRLNTEAAGALEYTQRALNFFVSTAAQYHAFAARVQPIE